MESESESEGDWEFDWELVSWAYEDDDLEEDSHPPQLLESGCLDRDNPDRLSPVFRVEKRDDQVSIVGLDITIDRSASESPVKNLISNQEAIHFAALCTGQGESSRVKCGKARFTAVAVSPTQVLSADHSKFVDTTCQLEADEYRVTLDEGQSAIRTTAKLSKPEQVKPKGDHPSHPMSDPLHGTLYHVPRSAACADSNFWHLLPDPKVSPKVGTGNVKHITRFQKFILPASIKYFQGSLTCSLVMFPDVNTFLSGFTEGSKEAREFCREFWSNNSAMVLNELQTSKLPESKEARIKFKEELSRKIYDLLTQTWSCKLTGNCYVGVGRVLGHNMTTIAHSVSTLPGSSGAALIPIGTQGVKGVFIGVQTGPAPSLIKPLFCHKPLVVTRPDHNLATSCDNPEFVTDYWRSIVNNLPQPSKIPEESLKPFLHWISLHLRLILSCKDTIVSSGSWSEKQKLWLRAGIFYMLGEDNKSFTDFSDATLRKIQSSPAILRQLNLPANERLEDLNNLRSVKIFRVDLAEWNVPIICVYPAHFSRIAAKLDSDDFSDRQEYLNLPLKAYGECRLVKYGIEISGTAVEVLVHAIGLGFCSFFIANERDDQTLRDTFKFVPEERDRIQVLVRAGTSEPERFCAGLEERISRMECKFVDVLFVDLSEMKALEAELRAALTRGLVKTIGLRTDLLEDLIDALGLFKPSLVQVNVSTGIVPDDIKVKCEALNVGLVSTSDLWHRDAFDLQFTTAQVNAVWKSNVGVLPFTVVQTEEELSQLHKAVTVKNFSVALALS